MTLSKRAKLRLLQDIKKLHKAKEILDELNIYYLINDENIQQMYVMFVGSPETPYEGGFYFFDIKIPDTYPIKPPKVKFLTLSSDVRIHPNLYTEGKVCLSIINTWDGDGWSASQTLETLFLSMKSYIFVEEPLRNEPGYEKSKTEGEVESFTNFVTYQNFRVAINMMLIDIKSKNPLYYFKNIMNKYINDNISRYLERYEKLVKTADNIKIYCGVYGKCSSCITNYGEQYLIFNKYCKINGLSLLSKEKK